MEGRYRGMDYRRRPAGEEGRPRPQAWDWDAYYAQLAQEEAQHRTAGQGGTPEATPAPRSYEAPPRPAISGGQMAYRPQTQPTVLVDREGSYGAQPYEPLAAQPRHASYVEGAARPTRQRVAVGRGHEVQSNDQALAAAARLHAERYAAYEEAPAPQPEDAYATVRDPNAGAYYPYQGAEGGSAETASAYEAYGQAGYQEAYGQAYEEPAAQPSEPLPEDDPIAAWEAQRAQEQGGGERQSLTKRGHLEKKMSLIVLFILTFTFALGTVLMVILPRSTVSKIEKRELATMPEFSLMSYFSGEYTAGVANFYDDTVPLRDELKNVGNNLKALFGLPKADDSVQFVGNVQRVGGKKDPLPVPVSQPEGTPVPESEGPVSSGPKTGEVGENIGGGTSLLAGAAGRHMDTTQAPVNNFREQEAEGNITENGLVVIKQDGHFRGLELFGGGVGESYAEALNDLYRQVGDHVQIWSMPAPLACEFYLPSNFSDWSVSQSDSFDETHALLDPGIHALNMCETLSRHVDEPIYCRTDHHWQPLGAYYAAKLFAEAAEVPFDDIGTYTPGSIEGFVGSMYSYTGSADILNDPEDFVYYTPSTSYTAAYYNTAFSLQWDDDDLFAEGASGSDAYMYYLGGDAYIVKTDTEVKNGRKLLIVKDSYGNAIVPFFTGSFEQIYVADVRYLERNLVSFINDMGITDTLFTMSSYSFVGSQGQNIANLLTQNAGETIIDEQLNQE